MGWGRGEGVASGGGTFEKLAEEGEVGGVGAFAFVLLEETVLVEHQFDEFVFAVADDDHVDLLCYYLILH